MTIEFPENFPRAPPNVRFVTRILHCNINSYGRVCHSILDRNWSSTTSIKSVLDNIYGLLLVPDVDDPLDSTLALARADDSGAYEGTIIAHTKRYACRKTMDEWEEEFTAEQLVPISASDTRPPSTRMYNMTDGGVNGKP